MYAEKINRLNDKTWSGDIIETMVNNSWAVPKYDFHRNYNVWVLQRHVCNTGAVKYITNERVKKGNIVWNSVMVIQLCFV